MRLVYQDYNFTANISQAEMTVIIAENPKTFCDFVSNIREMIDGKVEKVLLTDNSGAMISTDKCHIILSPMDFQLNSKKILNSIYKEISQIVKEELWMQEQELNNAIIDFLDRAVLKLPYELIYEKNIDTQDFLKLYKLNLLENYDCLLEKLINYVKIISQVSFTKCLFLVNIHDFLSVKNLDMLYEIALYNDVSLIMIESHQREKSSYEHTYILDDNNCLIEF
ncbi:CRISPR type II-A/NMEMI-associated protein Csn2 [Peptostreptococcaceae bacterium AS15]|nr:CRISPR type II-A/NMEMI-associated protein Csn2 [Peptostreptococcaceae bacterium AS15]